MMSLPRGFESAVRRETDVLTQTPLGPVCAPAALAAGTGSVLLCSRSLLLSLSLVLHHSLCLAIVLFRSLHHSLFPPFRWLSFFLSLYMALILIHSLSCILFSPTAPLPFSLSPPPSEEQEKKMEECRKDR